MFQHLRPSTALLLMFLAVAGSLALSSGCDSGGGTVQPPPVEKVPATTGPVDEPPSTDEK
jgi:hypothetical protein